MGSKVRSTSLIVQSIMLTEIYTISRLLHFFLQYILHCQCGGKGMDILLTVLQAPIPGLIVSIWVILGKLL